MENVQETPVEQEQAEREVDKALEQGNLEYALYLRLHAKYGMDNEDKSNKKKSIPAGLDTSGV